MKTINQITQEFGLSANSSYGDILEKLTLVTVDEINNIKTISVKPLPNVVRDKALELKDRMVNMVIDEDKGSTSIINKRIALIVRLLDSLSSSISSEHATNESDNERLTTLEADNASNKNQLSDLNEEVFSYNDGLSNMVRINHSERITSIENKILMLDEILNNREFLQSQIDAINAAQNLTDIVSNYEALENYDTSKLMVGDKIQVLTDENYELASTVYNWNGTSFDFIGKYGQEGYTKNESNEIFVPKRINLLNNVTNDVPNDRINLFGNNNLNDPIKITITDISKRIIRTADYIPNDLQVGQYLRLEIDEEE